MTELERALVELGGELDFPPTPRLAGRVSARVAARERPRRRVRRTLVLAFALSTRSTVAAWTGDAGVCRECAARALEIESQLQLGGTRAYTELALATLALASGDSARAADHSIKGLEFSREYGEARKALRSLAGLDEDEPARAAYPPLPSRTHQRST